MNYCQQCAQTVVMLNRGCGSVMVESIAANVSVVVRRQRAEFGSVTVFCFAQSVRNGASQNEDFIFQPRVQLACVSFSSFILGYSWPVCHFASWFFFVSLFKTTVLRALSRLLPDFSM